MTGAFSLAVNGNKRWFPEIADIPVLQKTYRGTNCFFTESQYTDIPVISPTPNVDIFYCFDIVF